MLQNLSQLYTRPCILDVKLGTELYAPEATDEKKARMEKTAKETTSYETGLRLTGFQVGYLHNSADRRRGILQLHRTSQLQSHTASLSR